MFNEFKFTYANINKSAFSQELDRRGLYYANVVMWTTFFTLPLFWLVDYLFCKSLWLEFFMIRLVGIVACYLVYTNAKTNKWTYLKTTVWFVAIIVVINSITAALVPNDVENPLAYFLILGIIMLIINTTIFWPPIHSIYLCALSFFTVFIVYALKQNVNKYHELFNQGGVVYFILAVFSCLLAYTRFQVLCRDVERSVMIDDANEKLFNKAEQIKDLQYQTADTNRKLKSVSESSLDNMTVLMHDYKSFSDTVKSSVEVVKRNGENLLPSQLDALNKISLENEKLNYLAEKLGGTATAVTTISGNIPSASLDNTIQFNKEHFDLNPEVEKAVFDIAEGAMMKGMNLQLNISPASNKVYQDKLFTDQVLNKLMNNLIKISKTGSIITVRAENVNNLAVVETVSHGNVIGMEKLEEMMNRLRYSSITDETALNDLGLIATKKLVEAMGGKFTFNSEENTGNYFKVEFPSAN
jgi:K+-sensing histidine kinase KdpD